MMESIQIMFGRANFYKIEIRNVYFFCLFVSTFFLHLRTVKRKLIKITPKNISINANNNSKSSTVKNKKIKLYFNLQLINIHGIFQNKLVIKNEKKKNIFFLLPSIVNN